MVFPHNMFLLPLLQASSGLNAPGPSEDMDQDPKPETAG